VTKKILLFAFVLVSITAGQLHAEETAPTEKLSPTQPNVYTATQATPVPSTQSQATAVPTAQSQPTAVPTPQAQPTPVQGTQPLEIQVALLNDRVANLRETQTWLLAFLALILGVGVFSWFRDEGRAGRAEQRTIQAHELAVRGEEAAQQRIQLVQETFLESSKETLDLVNQTLTLAYQASERAAKLVENRAKSILRGLDSDSRKLLESVPSQEDRALVANSDRRSRLHSLAEKINGFEINSSFLDDLPEFELTPACLFIRGMDFHLGQQFYDAIDCWESTTLCRDADNKLKSLAWYWIGYEYNNLGKFDDAHLYFGKAREVADGARRYELQRIMIETRFFSKKEPAAQLIQALVDLLRSIEQEGASEEFQERRRGILTQLGNVYLQAGNDLRKEGQPEEARKMYECAKEAFAKAADENKWALFGLGQAQYGLGEEREAERIFKDKIRPKAIEEYINREEPRTKAMAKMTELICCIRVPSLKDEGPGIYVQVLEALGRADERLTVFSQMQKRNVTKSEFRKDLEEFMEELPRS